jgi:PTS system nitrogen regulatory IIA component
MQLSDYIKREHINCGFEAPDKPGAMAALCRLAAGLSGADAQALLNVVMHREAMGSTGLGGGVALPHSHTSLVDKPLVILAISPKGVDFESLDNKPVRLFILLLTPADGDSREHLQLLARLGAMFKSNDTVEEFLSAQSPDEVFELILKRQ